MIHPRLTPSSSISPSSQLWLWRTLRAAGLTVAIAAAGGMVTDPNLTSRGMGMGAAAAQERSEDSDLIFPEIPREGWDPNRDHPNGDHPNEDHPNGDHSLDGENLREREPAPEPSPSLSPSPTPTATPTVPPAPQRSTPEVSPSPEVEPSPDPEERSPEWREPANRDPANKDPKPNADPFSPLGPSDPFPPRTPDAQDPRFEGDPRVLDPRLLDPRFEGDGDLTEKDPPPNVPLELLEPVDPWRAYRLSPLDRIVVQVFGYPDLSFTNNVDQGGRILVPLVGFLKVEGLTLEELQEVLTTAYNDYVVDPEVLVTLGSQVNPDIVVSGEVVRPGFYRVGSFETVVQALISAGGVKDSADLRAIALRRRLPDGSLLEQQLNLLSLLSDGLPEPRLFLQDGDVVFVPRREVVNDPTYDFALATLNNLGSPSIRVRLLNYAGGAGRLQTITLPAGSSFIDALNGLPFTEVNVRKVALIRFEPEQGRVVTQKLDGRAAILGDLSQNPQLRDNDVIVVNQTLISKITSFFNRFTQPFRDVLGFLLFFQQLETSATDLFGPEGLFQGGNSEEGNSDN